MINSSSKRVRVNPIGSFMKPARKTSIKQTLSESLKLSQLFDSVECIRRIRETSKTSSHRLLVRESAEDTRGHWANKAEFLLSCIGMSVGLGNLWRFPTLAYENGGAAFFIPYIILQVFIGNPMYFMELCMGQYMGRGATGVFAMCPAFKGIGISMILVSIILTIYYNGLLGFTLYYAIASLKPSLPYATCQEEWLETYNCYSRSGKGKSIPLCYVNSSIPCKCSGVAEYDFNLTDCAVHRDYTYETLKTACVNSTRCTNDTLTPSHLYFYKVLMDRDSVLSNIGTPNAITVLCLILSYAFIVLALVRGVKSTGKIVYVTALFPYVVLVVMVIRNAILPGALDGMKFFMFPDWSKLRNYKTWYAAAEQMTFSLGFALGPVIMLGSYNKFNNSVLRDAITITTTDLITSFVAGCVVFTTLGIISKDTGVPIENVARSDLSLAFVIYPEALTALPGTNFWGFIFFAMLFFLGVDSSFTLIEEFLTALWDEYPALCQRKLCITVMLGYCLFMLGLPITTPGGLYVLTLMDVYSHSLVSIILAFAEITTIMWIYGVRNFVSDVRYMLGSKPTGETFWVACWVAVTPAVLFILIVMLLVNHTPPTYYNHKPFPVWAQLIGWCLTLFILSPIPIYFVYCVYNTKGDDLKQRIVHACRVSNAWKPQNLKLEGLRASQKAKLQKTMSVSSRTPPDICVVEKYN